MQGSWRLLFWYIIISISWSCSKKTDQGTMLPILTLRGKVEVPTQFSVYSILSAEKATSNISRFACPKDGNGSAIKGPVIFLHTQKNCSDAQWVYFYLNDPVDLSAYAQGAVEIRLEATGGSMSINAKLQDDAAQISQSVDLATVGFVSTNNGIEQKILIPISAFGEGDIDLSKVKRPLHLDVTCSSTNCYLSVFSIRWLGPKNVASPPLVGGRRLCDPFPCRALPKAKFRIYRPSSLGWTATPVVSGVTDNEGNFNAMVERANLEPLIAEGTPIVFAAAEDGSEHVFSNIITLEDFKTTSIELDISLESTIASRLICPGGHYPAPSGRYCRPVEAALREHLLDQLTAYFASHPPTSDDLNAITAAAAASGEIAATVQTIVGDPNIPSTPDQISTWETQSPLPTPSEGYNSLKQIPNNIPTGTYLLNTDVCAAGNCQQQSNTIEVTGNTADTVSQQITQAFSQTSFDCNQTGISCVDRYSAFNGYSFSASRFLRSCSGDICISASVSIKMIRK